MPDRAERRRILVEALGAFAVATFLSAVLVHAQSIPLVGHNLHALVALVFLAIPQILLQRRGGIERYGFRAQPIGIGLTIAFGAILVVLPLFAVGFWGSLRIACAHFADWVPGSCLRVLHPHWRLPPDFAWLILAQLLVVALPEELFFRGYLQGRLSEALPPTVSLFGAKVGRAWILSSLLFGLGHCFSLGFGPLTLLRFFPGLVFGWMYARTNSILAGTIFHAACNLIMAILGASLLT